jgi:hypothetical protein
MAKSPEVLLTVFLMLSPLNYSQECLNAHSHNDYKRERPLIQALENGFRSFEADIFLREGSLLVAHSEDEIDPGKTLEAMYLKPLKELMRDSSFNCTPYILLIDIKENGEKVYPVLDELLEKYSFILTGYKNENVYENKVSVILSGDRPVKEVLKDTTRFAAIDGRFEDINKPSYLYPMISEDWFTTGEYINKNISSLSQADGLKDLAARIIKSNKLFRIWNAPDNEKSWKFQADAGVSLINTDNITGLKKFLLKHQKSN